MSRFVVLNPNGSYAGVLCTSLEEARELAAQQKGRVIGEIIACKDICPHIHCPVNGWDCPYWIKGGICGLDNPFEECDDFALAYDEGENYTCNGDSNCSVWNTNE